MYKEVKMSDAWDFEANNTFEGLYQGRSEEVGPNKSMLYEFKMLDGNPMAVWGSTVLDTKLKHVEIGQRVKIVSLGKVKSPKGTEYKDFSVAVWED